MGRYSIESSFTRLSGPVKESDLAVMLPSIRPIDSNRVGQFGMFFGRKVTGVGGFSQPMLGLKLLAISIGKWADKVLRVSPLRPSSFESFRGTL